jgi:hypothetical protein
VKSITPNTIHYGYSHRTGYDTHSRDTWLKDRLLWKVSCFLRPSNSGQQPEIRHGLFPNLPNSSFTAVTLSLTNTTHLWTVQGCWIGWDGILMLTQVRRRKELVGQVGHFGKLVRCYEARMHPRFIYADKNPLTTWVPPFKLNRGLLCAAAVGLGSPSLLTESYFPSRTGSYGKHLYPWYVLVLLS